MRAALLAVVLASAGSGCVIDRACTTILIFGVTVDVTGPGMQPVPATVTLRDGSFVEVIEPDDAHGTQYSGAGERAGTYDVTVEADGFATVVIDNVRVEDGDCHVQPARLVVELEPL